MPISAQSLGGLPRRLQRRNNLPQTKGKDFMNQIWKISFLRADIERIKYVLSRDSSVLSGRSTNNRKLLCYIFSQKKNWKCF